MKKSTGITLVIVILAVVAIGYGLYRVGTKPPHPLVGEFFPAQSREHIQVGTPHDAYNTNPPTGGWHYAEPAQTGIYDKEIVDEQLVHNLEHSHVWIAYKPGKVSAEDINKLADVAKSYGSKIVMTPRAANPDDAPIALVAWEHLEKLQTFDEAKVREFIDDNRSYAGPVDERLIPDSGFKDFRTQ